MNTMNSNLPIDEAIYVQGYNQAVKDLALTWRDIQKIVTLADQLAEYADA